jgi:hypothetical protein
MVLVKNFVLLVCDALEDLGLGAGPLEVREGREGADHRVQPILDVWLSL